MKIEKNIPIITRRGWGKYSTIVYKMEEGDSVLCKNYKEVYGMRRAIYNCKGYKPVERKQKDGTYRIWKVRKDPEVIGLYTDGSLRDESLSEADQ